MAYSYKRIPYGIANFMHLRRNNFYYVDKTRFLPLLEEMGEALFLIRPRRMGKSLWLSVLANYYDVNRKDNFDELFGDLWIAGRPTEERNSYLILKFNFSTVNPDIRKVEDSFEENGYSVFMSFLDSYRSFFPEHFFAEIGNLSTTSARLKHLFRYATAHDLKIYVIIDEYDNFANTILSMEGAASYRELTHGTGFYRHFFNVLKGGTSEEGGGSMRLFITGVSPVTMDDVTSGYNIGKLISLDPRLNEFIGLTEDELLAMIDYYRSVDKFPLATDDILPLMREWYDNYRFAKNAGNSLFNTDMALYFVDQVAGLGQIPEELIDQNVRIDYGKLRHLLTIDQRLNGNFSHLRNIMETGGVDAQVRIVTGFPVERLNDPDNFHSLLYYFGLLSFNGEGKDSRLRIPNRTVRKLMYGYLRDAYRDVDVFRLNVWEFAELMDRMAYDGAWEPVFDFMGDAIRAQTSVRDYLYGEKIIQGFLLAYLNVTDLFQSRSEFEMRKGFADFFLEPFFAQYPDVRHGYIVEIKYLPRSETVSPEKIAGELTEARGQLERYAADEFVRERTGAAMLHKLALVFHGWELVAREEV